MARLAMLDCHAAVAYEAEGLSAMSSIPDRHYATAGTRFVDEMRDAGHEAAADSSDIPSWVLYRMST